VFKMSATSPCTPPRLPRSTSTSFSQVTSRVVNPVKKDRCNKRGTTHGSLFSFDCRLSTGSPASLSAGATELLVPGEVSDDVRNFRRKRSFHATRGPNDIIAVAPLRKLSREMHELGQENSKFNASITNIRSDLSEVREAADLCCSQLRSLLPITKGGSQSSGTMPSPRVHEMDSESAEAFCSSSLVLGKGSVRESVSTAAEGERRIDPADGVRYTFLEYIDKVGASSDAKLYWDDEMVPDDSGEVPWQPESVRACGPVASPCLGRGINSVSSSWSARILLIGATILWELFRPGLRLSRVAV